MSDVVTTFNREEQEYLARILQNTFEPLEHDEDNILRDLINALRNGDTIEFDDESA